MSATLQDIVQNHIHEIESMNAQQRKALTDIATCGTPARGEMVMRCDNCDHAQRYWASCGNRHCNRCGQHKNAEWQAKQLENALPIGYFMVTFTIPKHVQDIFRYNQSLCYDLMFRCSADTLQQGIAYHYGWGEHVKIGFASFLHTWTQDLNYHPHVHLILPAGAYDPSENEWHPMDKKYLIPWQILSRRFKGKLVDALTLKFKKDQLKIPPQRKPFKDADSFKRYLQGNKKIDWRIDITKPYGQSTGAMDYMARYVNRTAIGNNRILSANDREVVIKTRDRDKNVDVIVNITPKLFLQRFLHHVLPKGFTRIRWYGFLSCGQRRRNLEQIRDIIDDQSPPASLQRIVEITTALSQRLAMKVCKSCQKGKLSFSGLVPPLSLSAKLFAANELKAKHCNVPNPNAPARALMT